MFQSIIESIVRMAEILKTSDLGVSYSSLAITSIATTVIFALTAFILKGIGLYLTAKKNCYDNKWLAFVPFANYILVGKIIGDVKFFSTTVKNMGITVAIALPIAFGLIIFVDLYRCFDELMLIIRDNVLPTEIVWNQNTFISLLMFFTEILSFLVRGFFCWLIITYLAKYNRKNMLVYMIIFLIAIIFIDFWLLFNLLFGIMLIINRKKAPFDIQEYLRQQEAIRQAHEHHYNPNFSGYRQTKDDDPFDEFTNESKNSSALNQDVFSDFQPANDFTKRNNDLKEVDLNNRARQNHEKENNNKTDDDLFS